MADPAARRPDDQLPVDGADPLVTHTRCCFGRRILDPSLERQKAAGEEDQSVPGWEFGP